MVLDKSLNMEPKRIRLEASQVPLRPLQIQNNPQAASQHSSRAIQVPIYPTGTMVNGNNSNLQPGRIFVSNVRVRNPTLENTRDQRLLAPPQHNQINLTAGGMGVALGNTMTGAVVPPSGHLPNSMRHNPQQQQQSQVSLPSYNLHPMPPVFSGNVMRLPANMTGVGGVSQNITIPSVEVRIGSRKFKTTSGVCFKDDGVLFTLKDYSYAPVLLNARAILKCKANLNIVGYPVIFLFLETSCMKQIRNIFAISEEEFSHHSPIELLRYITIFPTYGPEHKGQSQHIMQSIKKSFDLMLKRFPRPNSVLEEITNEQCIDILYSSFNNNSDSLTGAATVRHGNVEEAVNHSSTAPVLSPLTQSSTAASPMNQQQQMRNDLMQRSPSQQPSTENFINAAVPLNIPSDQETWRQVQKDLTVGGVYHVMMPNGRKNYCLWNGTQLMPCLVQNTEVQMTCSHARFGMTLLKCIGQVRVKADQTTGIYFTVRNTKKELTEICIQPLDIVKMQIFFHAVNSSVIISVTPECSCRLSESAQLYGESSSLVRRTFDSASGDPSRSYLVLFIQQLHKDQEEALLQMKYSTTTQHIKKGSQMFESIDMQTAASFLCEIITGSSDAGKRYESTNNISSPQGYEKLVKTFLQKESLVLPPVSSINNNHLSSTTSVTAVDDDDDDDDIIMTQQELGVKCPYTQQVMKNPVMNKKCRHNYEKDAIFEFIALKKGNARCPYAGCANLDPLTAVDLENNDSLREYIEMKQKS